MVTIKEIALKTNYSSSTVSRVLNHDQSLSVSPETRQRILSIAKELGYKTVQERRSTKSDPSTEKVGILLCHSVEEELNDSYFLSIRQGIENECKKQGVQTTELFRLNNLQTGQISKDIEHLIVVGRINHELLEQLSDQLKNIVYINHLTDESQFDSIVLDFEKATRQAMDHLLGLGYKDIGYIGGQEIEYYSGRQKEFEEGRRATFQKVMEERGSFDPRKCLVGKFSISDGYRLMKEAIEQELVPEAIFTASDSMALGVIRALQEQQYRVPEDVAIVSFNDIELAEYSNPPLTTVRVPTEEMGRLGVTMMVDRLGGREIPLKVVVPTELVIRESCGARKGRGREEII
ncbi:LacI family DNA-binding transcriptional regulator [Halobacillus litoralis]|uniref:LacI family DNA-binding transcriptional regulator n=1 Tax=Halobacillus litoralis TaxID=45668 RepID=UPI001CD627E2|nr:LacI family DNA-binding transcriptional regulator [Halobacillus litoralis]